ncbi:MAG: DUF5689 domain-containing protein [Paludibacteraceae bacterium]
MKTLKYILSSAVVAVALTACHTYGEPQDKGYVEEGSEAEWKATMTIGEFLSDPQLFSEFGDVDKYPPRARSYQGANKSNENLGLFSVQDITADVTIVGRIVSTDVPGNVYKNLYIQDCANPDYGIKLAVDAGSLGGMYPIGQKIAIKLQGLAIGKYARMPQIGIPYYNNAKEGMDTQEKAGWEIGRIPPQVFKEHVQLIGQPDVSKIVAKTMTVANIKATADNYKDIALLSNRLVKIENVRFVPYTWDTYGALSSLSGTYNCATDGNANTFAPTTGGIGYPQSRLFTTDIDTVIAANSLAIGTSEFAKFACAPLPGDEYVGTVTGFVSYYYDNGKYSAVNDKVWSLTINGLESLELKNGDETWRADDVYYPAY